MAWPTRGHYSPRKGKNRLPEKQRRRIIGKATRCYFEFPGICTGLTGRVEIHHIADAQDGGSDDDANLAATCRPCHVHYSARRSSARGNAARNNWIGEPDEPPAATLTLSAEDAARLFG